MKKEVEDLAKEWLRIDKREETRDEIYKLLAQGNEQELASRLTTRIAFGTAGLRARMEAGFNRMNCVTVIQASQGLAAYLLENVPNTKKRGVVIGRDARRNSETFAQLATAAFVAQGIRVWIYPGPIHTPLVPFGVSEFNAAAGIMITASHNPKEDNGYKVYWENASQIIPPMDRGIARSIQHNLEPKSWDYGAADNTLLVESDSGLVEAAYVKAVSSIAKLDEHGPTLGDAKFVYTPMHGTGLNIMTKVMQELGWADNMVVVEEQAEPDPDFPTVAFPNPEEKGALDLSFRTADAHGISLVLASDPDADRLAVADKVNGRWIQFTGNQLGVLLASHVIDTYPEDKPKEKLAMLASTVSSKMLSTMAKAEKIHYAETLTGFKWIGNEAQRLEGEGYDALYGYEEALGYMFSPVARDKDSIASAAVFLSAVARWRNEGLTPWSKLQRLYTKYGHFEDANTYLISPSILITSQIFERIRGLGQPYPKKIGNRKILSWRDLTKGYDSATKDHQPTLPVSTDTEMITCTVEGNVRFTVRSSGTEPKIKLYIEGEAKQASDAKAHAEEVLRSLLEEWFKPDENGLQLA
ncbi:phosphoglucomutase-2 [Eremomyces bilateralis CBS 781.70]|uniref:Phosphoglucomutase-2 n=1 Tax=Eremomyces bilateralis CBS 781.70 TaxID=1392243 RepID=A0A6G1FTN1_9PEZI|nr:phosphoglucomutase-2 [Eremomyces bilateralis CBS 781.70]KAF1809042.1 phosphoglucomutase-2 [Eremomyces bilateralis CBS 781.70]